MGLTLLLLFVVTLMAGLAPLAISKVNSRYFHLALVFSGAYLFGITIMHLLPELFSGVVGNREVALWITVGFLMQVLLDHFTSGVEHGHLHIAHHDHHHGSVSMFTLLTAMSLHALLEGSLLANPMVADDHQHSAGLLTGIILHKMPAAFALMSLISCNYKTRFWPIALMILFSLATPVGMVLSDQLTLSGWLDSKAMTVLFALVTGNFLHISTTIFFESSPEHKVGGGKLITILLGTAVAVVAEFLG